MLTQSQVCFDETRVMGNEELFAWIFEQLDIRPVLLYSDTETAELAKTKELSMMSVTIDTDYQTLKSLDARDGVGKFNLLIVTDKAIMRGTDYRAPLNGILLVVSKQFDTPREE
jgi:hypothetical protein